VVIHIIARKLGKGQVMAALRKEKGLGPMRENYLRALDSNTRFYHSILKWEPKGWSRKTRDQLQQIVAEAGDYVQKLNSAFTNPSGAELTPEETAALAPRGAAQTRGGTGGPRVQFAQRD